MNINIQISDSTYRRLVSNGRRIQGSIGLVTPNEGNFNEYIRQPVMDGSRMRYIRLRHGRVSINREKIRLTLHIGLDETGIIPAEVIEDESREAGVFVDEILENIERYH